MLDEDVKQAREHVAALEQLITTSESAMKTIDQYVREKLSDKTDNPDSPTAPAAPAVPDSPKSESQ